MNTKVSDMDRSFRAFRLVVEIDTDLLDALNEEARRRSAGIRVASRAEVVRAILSDALLNSKKAGAMA